MKKKLYLLYVTIIFVCCDQLNPTLSQSAETSLLISSSLKMIWGLLVVLGLLLIIYGFARKKLSFGQVGNKGLIKIIESRHLMPKKSLFLIEIRGKQYLLGSGSDSIHLITPLEDNHCKPTFDELLQNSEINDHK